MMLNFKQTILKYLTGNFPVEQLPQLAILGIEQGYDTPSLRILAGLPKNEDTWTLDKYLRLCLLELGIVIPEKEQALLQYAVVIAEEIIAGEKDAFLGIDEMKSQVFDKADFKEKSQKYVYDTICFENVNGLYYEYDDLLNPLVGYSDGTSREDLMIEVRKKMLEELGIWKEKIISIMPTSNQM